MITSSAQQYQNAEDEKYKIIHILPHGYDPAAKENIEIFAKRLKEARNAVNLSLQTLPQSPLDPNPNPRAEKVTQKILARHIGVSTMQVSNYEAGEIEKVPLKHIRKICEYLYVTPHYLLGFVSNPTETLIFDKNGHPVQKTIKDKDGKITVVDTKLVEGMVCISSDCVAANEAYVNLFIEDSELYWLIRDMIHCPPSIREKCKNRLRESVPKRFRSK